MKDFKDAMNELFDRINEDYSTCYTNRDDELAKARNEKFASELRVEEGRKYIKVIAGSSVWGFIMKEDDKQFKKGDILKAASWSAPARNRARGNILDDAYFIRWTGPLYL